MSSSSKSESYQSNGTTNGPPDLLHLASVFAAVSDGTDQLENEVKNMKALQKSISHYKWGHIARTEATKERLSELTREIGIAGKNMVNESEEKLKELVELADPYTNSGSSTEKDESSRAMMNKCIELRGAIKGIRSVIEKNSEMSSIILQNHNQLKKMVETAQKATQEQAKLNRINNLLNEIPSDSPLHQLVLISKLLLTLERTPDISEYYQKKFGELEKKISLVLSGCLEPNRRGIGSELTTLSSLSNGEINVQEIADRNEIPIDSAAPGSTN